MAWPNYSFIRAQAGDPAKKSSGGALAALGTNHRCLLQQRHLLHSRNCRMFSKARRKMVRSLLRKPRRRRLLRLETLEARQLLTSNLIISEFRLFGPGSTTTLRDNNEFIELYNNTDSPLTVSSSSGTGFGVAASDGVLRFTIPNGTVIPARGHFLGVNSTGYAYTNYPEGNGTTSTGDATYTTDIPANAGIALFTTNVPADFSLAHRLDAVGSSSEANTLYKEGTGYPPVNGTFPIEHSFYRNFSSQTVTNPPFPEFVAGDGVPQDTDNNAADFVFVDTNGTSAGAGQRLGAPGPENLSAPIALAPTVENFPRSPLDPCSTLGTAPNKVRDFTMDAPNNSTQGTVDFRRTWTNNTGGNVSRLRCRILTTSTLPAAVGIADLRARTSTDVVVTVDRAPCGAGTSNITVHGTTLEQATGAPNTGQPNGGGFNSSMGVGFITLGTPLANGASVDVRFLFGIQQTGSYRIAIQLEALPTGGNLWLLEGNTEDTSDTEIDLSQSADLSVVKTDSPDPVTAGTDLTYTLTVNNAGPNDAQNMALSDTLPSGTTFVSAQQTGGTPLTLNTPAVGGTGTITTDPATLLQSTSATFQVVVHVNPNTLAGATISNTANVTSSTTDPNMGNNSATQTTSVIASADLVAVKS